MRILRAKITAISHGRHYRLVILHTYALMGKRAIGIKDLEKILVDDPDYPEVEKKLNELKK